MVLPGCMAALNIKKERIRCDDSREKATGASAGGEGIVDRGALQCALQCALALSPMKNRRGHGRNS